MAGTETVGVDAPLAAESPHVTTPDAAQPPAVIREVEHRDFVETFTVREGGKKYEVAANALANKARSQVNVSKIWLLCERAIKPYMDDPNLIPTPKDLKVLTDAFALATDMSNAAYGDNKKGGQMANALERLAYGMTRAAVEAGIQKSHSPEARLNRLKKVGKGKPKEPEDKVIEIPAA